MKNQAIYQIECRNNAVKLMDDTRGLAVFRANTGFSCDEWMIERLQSFKSSINAPDDVWSIFSVLALHVENGDLPINRIDIEFPDREINMLVMDTPQQRTSVCPDDITQIFSDVEALRQHEEKESKGLALINSPKSVPTMVKPSGVPVDVWELFIASAKKARRKNKKKISIFAVS